MLSPETTEALEKALSAVLDEIEDDPEYEALAEHLRAAKDAMPEGGEADEAEAPEGDEGDDEESPTDSFEEARKRFQKRRQKPPAAADDDEADGEE